MAGRILVVGDIHGCLDEFDALLRLADFGRKDRLVLLGDLIDRGPSPAGVVRRCFDLAAGGSAALLVRGNHEQKFLRWLHHRRHHPELCKQMQGVGAFTDLAEELEPKHLKWLRQSALWHPLPGGLAVHAGIPIGLDALPEANTSPDQGKSSLMRLMNLRFQTTEGKAVMLGSETPADRFWAETYDGRFGHVYFGHHAFTGRKAPVAFPHATGMDLGCVYGGHLAATVFLDGEISHLVVESRFTHTPNNRDSTTSL